MTDSPTMNMRTVEELTLVARTMSPDVWSLKFGPAALVLQPPREELERAVLARLATHGSVQASLMDQTLIMLRAFRDLQVFPLVPLAGRVTIGRMTGRDVCLSDLSVSKHHATICLQDGRWGVEDHGSLNGTSINNSRIAGLNALTDGDVIGVGDVTLVFLSAHTLHGQLRALAAQRPRGIPTLVQTNP